MAFPREVKLDENLPEESSVAFRNAGWDCRTVAEQGLSGGDDAQVSEACTAEQRILVTFDRGFSNLKTYAQLHSVGVVLLRLRRQDKPNVLAVVARLITALIKRELRGELWIVYETRIRVRPITARTTLDGSAG